MLDYEFELREHIAGRKAQQPNPFLRDEQGSVRSMAGISALIRVNPEKARRLCQEAGERLETWFPENPL